MPLIFLGIIRDAVESRTILRDVAMESHNGDDSEAKYHTGRKMNESTCAACCVSYVLLCSVQGLVDSSSPMQFSDFLDFDVFCCLVRSCVAVLVVR
jgi:hypothetical protein